MGLKYLYQGNVYDFSGTEYDPGDLGTVRLRIKKPVGEVRLGLTTDPTASSYSPLKFRLANNVCYIGRSGTSSTSESNSRSYTSSKKPSTTAGISSTTSLYSSQAAVTHSETYTKTVYTSDPQWYITYSRDYTAYGSSSSVSRGNVGTLSASSEADYGNYSVTTIYDCGQAIGDYHISSYTNSTSHVYESFYNYVAKSVSSTLSVNQTWVKNQKGPERVLYSTRRTATLNLTTSSSNRKSTVSSKTGFYAKTSHKILVDGGIIAYSTYSVVKSTYGKSSQFTSTITDTPAKYTYRITTASSYSTTSSTHNFI